MAEPGRRVRRSRWTALLLVVVTAAAMGAGTQASAAAGWEIVPSPNGGSTRSGLADVVALSATDVWAVGSAFDPAKGADRALVQHWNGTAWSMVSTPLVARYFSALVAVSATGPNDVWAVGSLIKKRFDSEHSLILHWDGAAWTQMLLPGHSQWDGLTGVAAVSPDDVWAVGNGYRGAFILHWDGSSWRRAPSTNAAWLNDVAALGPDDVWAVGQGPFEGGTYPTFTQHWNGTQWSVVDSPNVPADFNQLQGVSGSSSNDVWAAGAWWDSTKPFHPLITHWDGTEWKLVPAAPMPEGELFDVVGLSPSNAWAVGTSGGDTVTEQWTGSAWSRVPSPSPGIDDTLVAVAEAGGVGWAVGTTYDGSSWRTLILRTLSP